MPRKLNGSFIQTGSITTTQLSSAVTQVIEAGGGPRVSSLIYPGNDTAGNTVGGQTVYINGSGFETNNAIYINGNAVPSKSFISASNLSFTTPALSAGIYPVYVINTDSGATAIFVPGYISSAEPTWVTGATLSSQEATGTWNIPLSASGDAPITYALAGGSSLPSGITLAANGLISGTLSSPPNDETQYSFTVIATDAQNQDASRAFTVTASVGEGVVFANNVLLIHADGTNNGNNHAFIDSSNNNFAITRSGNPTQGSFSPFSQTGWSNYFDGTGDYLTTTSSTAFSLGSGDFTIEVWANFNGTTDVNGDAILFIGDSTTNRPLSFYRAATNTFLLDLSTGGSNITQIQADGTIPSGVWMHFAATRSANTINIYFNGVLTKTQSYSSTLASYTGTVYIGRVPWNAPSGDFPGYISNLRVVKGTAVYTSNFTPPTTALTAIANTSLLTCQSNRFVDKSTNALTITRNGDVSVQAFSPFAPGVAYSTANNGASGYFDGSDSFSVSSGSGGALNFGSGDFTVESWIYPTTSFGATQYMLFGNTAVGGATFRITDSSLIIDRYNQAKDLDGGHTNQPYSWAHVAFVREGSTLRVYKNGVQLTSASTSSSYDFTSFSLASGAGLSTYAGYFSGLRAVKGQCLYPGGTTFTVPTSPPTNVANTQFLCNFTNAQIFDQTAKNVIETVGDAKVSTAQYKYGTGSVYFDGTGDYLVAPYSSLMVFPNDFTVEFWMYPTAYSSPGNMIICQGGSNNTDVNGWSIQFGSSFISFITRHTAPPDSASSSSAPALNTWTHIAAVRYNGVIKIYVNGTAGSTTDTTTGTITNSTYPLYIGRSALQDYWGSYQGYLDDIRISNYARYTSNFTPPTSALKDK